LDGSQSINDDDKTIEALLKTTNLLSKTILLVNKSDLPQELGENMLPAANNILHISCKAGAGLDPLEEAILATCGENSADEGLIFVNDRHCAALKCADSAISEAETALSANASSEIVAFHIREAMDNLGEITGDTTDEEILERIFSNFCIGK
jgi:tRNA modification GTPase